MSTVFAVASVEDRAARPRERDAQQLVERAWIANAAATATTTASHGFTLSCRNSAAAGASP
jgi:hypothetical protein